MTDRTITGRLNINSTTLAQVMQLHCLFENIDVAWDGAFVVYGLDESNTGIAVVLLNHYYKVQDIEVSDE